MLTKAFKKNYINFSAFYIECGGLNYLKHLKGFLSKTPKLNIIALDK